MLALETRITTRGFLGKLEAWVGLGKVKAGKECHTERSQACKGAVPGDQSVFKAATGKVTKPNRNRTLKPPEEEYI